MAERMIDGGVAGGSNAAVVLLKDQSTMATQPVIERQLVERPTFSCKIYLDDSPYMQEQVISGLQRAVETIRKGLVESDRIRDSAGMTVLGSYRVHRWPAS